MNKRVANVKQEPGWWGARWSPTSVGYEGETSLYIVAEGADRLVFRCSRKGDSSGEYESFIFGLDRDDAFYFATLLRSATDAMERTYAAEHQAEDALNYRNGVPGATK
jgi:hypothetical protein